jgi:hypothetical protein
MNCEHATAYSADTTADLGLHQQCSNLILLRDQNPLTPQFRGHTPIVLPPVLLYTVAAWCTTTADVNPLQQGLHNTTRKHRTHL